MTIALQVRSPDPALSPESAPTAAAVASFNSIKLAATSVASSSPPRSDASARTTASRRGSILVSSCRQIAPGARRQHVERERRRGRHGRGHPHPTAPRGRHVGCDDPSAQAGGWTDGAISPQSIFELVHHSSPRPSKLTAHLLDRVAVSARDSVDRLTELGGDLLECLSLEYLQMQHFPLFDRQRPDRRLRSPDVPPASRRSRPPFRAVARRRCRLPPATPQRAVALVAHRPTQVSLAPHRMCPTGFPECRENLVPASLAAAESARIITAYRYSGLSMPVVQQSRSSRPDRSSGDRDVMAS